MKNWSWKFFAKDRPSFVASVEVSKVGKQNFESRMIILSLLNPYFLPVWSLNLILIRKVSLLHWQRYFREFKQQSRRQKFDILVSKGSHNTSLKYFFFNFLNSSKCWNTSKIFEWRPYFIDSFNNIHKINIWRLCLEIGWRLLKVCYKIWKCQFSYDSNIMRDRAFNVFITDKGNFEPRTLKNIYKK